MSLYSVLLTANFIVTFVRYKFTVLQLKYRNSAGKNEVFDPFRKKWVAATPEEMVRQRFCFYLVNDLHYPQGLIANEYTIDVNGQKQRCDTLVFKDGRYVMMVEYKAPDVEITQAVFDQVSRYNSIIKARYAIVTNSKQCYCCKFDFAKHQSCFLKSLPLWEEI